MMKYRLTVLLCLVMASLSLAAETADDNLLKNPGFEVLLEADPLLPDGWFYFASTEKREVYVTSDNSLSGTNSLYLGAQGVKNGSEGLAQEMPVVPGRKYIFSVNLTHDKQHRMGKSVSGCIGIEWRSDGEEIERVISPYWDRELSRIRWERLTLESEAPRDATHARFVVYFYDGDRAGTGGCFLDDAIVTAE